MKRRAVSKRRVYPILSQSRFHQISDGRGWSTYWFKVNPTSNHEPAAASVGNWMWKNDKLLIWLKRCLFGEFLAWKQNKRTTCNSKARGFTWRSIIPSIHTQDKDFPSSLPSHFLYCPYYLLVFLMYVFILFSFFIFLFSLFFSPLIKYYHLLNQIKLKTSTQHSRSHALSILVFILMWYILTFFPCGSSFRFEMKWNITIKCMTCILV